MQGSTPNFLFKVTKFYIFFFIENFYQLNYLKLMLCFFFFCFFFLRSETHALLIVRTRCWSICQWIMELKCVQLKEAFLFLSEKKWSIIVGTIHLLKRHYTNCLTPTKHHVKRYENSYHQTKPKLVVVMKKGCLAMEETTYS